MTPQIQAEQKAREFIKKLLPNMPNWTSTENRAFEELTLLMQKADALDLITPKLNQLDDYFELGEVCFEVSKRFPFAQKLIKESVSTINQARKEQG
jgi:hypothetical protein